MSEIPAAAWIAESALLALVRAELCARREKLAAHVRDQIQR